MLICFTQWNTRFVFRSQLHRERNPHSPFFPHPFWQLTWSYIRKKIRVLFPKENQLVAFFRRNKQKRACIRTTISFMITSLSRGACQNCMESFVDTANDRVVLYYPETAPSELSKFATNRIGNQFEFQCNLVRMDTNNAIIVATKALEKAIR